MFAAGHPDEEVLELYAMGRVSELETAPIEEHIMVCAHCQERLESAELYIRSMQGALDKQATHGQRAPWYGGVAALFRMPSLGWAAAAVLLLCLGWVIGTRTHGSGSPVAISLTATRGEMASIPSGSPLVLELDARDYPPDALYRVQVVDNVGHLVWEQQPVPFENGQVHARVDRSLKPGQYFVRLFGPAGEPPREFGLQIRGR